MFVNGKNRVEQFLGRAFFAVLSYSNVDTLLSQLMIFSHDSSGCFYLFSENEHSLFQSLEKTQTVSVLIYKEEEKLDDICQVNVLGKASVISALDTANTKLACDSIAAKSPFIADSFESKENKYTLIKLVASSISLISFADIKANLSPMYLKRTLEKDQSL